MASPFFLDAHSQYYTEYRLSILLDRLNYELSSVEMVKESFFIEDGTYDFLVAKVVAVNKQTGMISYPVIYPRYFTEDGFNTSFGGQCDDLDVRFSVLFNKTGIFSPLWTGLVKNGKCYNLEGPRMDWDKMRGKAPRMSIAQYRFLKSQAKDSSYLQNEEVIFRSVPIWLLNSSVITDD